MKKLYIFIGKPGSGKGTQVNLLSKAKDAHVVRTGDGARELAKTNTIIAHQLEKGELVDNNIINQIFVEKFTTAPDNAILLSDGFPRMLEQAVWLDNFLKEHNSKIEAVILLNITDDEVINRLSQRQRHDDSSSVVVNRLALYRKYTIPVIDYYRQQGLLRELSATGDIDDVYQRIIELIK